MPVMSMLIAVRCWMYRGCISMLLVTSIRSGWGNNIRVVSIIRLTITLDNNTRQ
jgi:hypothetical protein